MKINLSKIAAIASVIGTTLGVFNSEQDAGSRPSPETRSQEVSATSMPTPTVRVPQKLARPKGSPMPMKSGEGPRTVEEIVGFRRKLRLPMPSSDELADADPEVRRILGIVLALPATIEKSALLRLLPEIDGEAVWVSKGSWSILKDKGHEPFWNGERGRREVFVGMTLVPATLARIRQKERDGVAYFRAFKDDYTTIYPVENSYVVGRYDGTPATMIEVFSRSEAFLYSWTLHMQILEHRENGISIVERVDIGNDTHWASGRDRWFEVTDGGRPLGHFLVSEFGLDIKSVPDDRGDIRDAIRANLEYLRTP